jgi:hypothetical protein
VCVTVVEAQGAFSRIRMRGGYTPAVHDRRKLHLSILHPDVLASAERVADHIVTTYSEPNLTPEEIHSMAAQHEGPLLCRRELDSLWNAL